MKDRPNKIKAGMVAIDGRALAALAEALAPYLVAALAKPDASDDFSSVTLPPHVSRRAFRLRCAGIEGAYKIGHVWYCPRAAWFASARRSAPAPVPPAAPAVTSDEDLAAKMIADAGLRTTRAA